MEETKHIRETMETIHILALAKHELQKIQAENKRLAEALAKIAMHTDDDVIRAFVDDALGSTEDTE